MSIEVTVLTCRTIDGETEQETQTAVGSRDTASNGVYRLRYTEPAGQGGAAVQVLTDGAQLFLRREGEIKTSLRLEPNKPHMCRIGVPGGELVLESLCRRLTVAFSERQDHLRFAYTLSAEGQPFGQYETEITVREVFDE